MSQNSNTGCAVILISTIFIIAATNNIFFAILPFGIFVVIMILVQQSGNLKDKIELGKKIEGLAAELPEDVNDEYIQNIKEKINDNNKKIEELKDLKVDFRRNDGGN